MRHHTTEGASTPLTIEDSLQVAPDGFRWLEYGLLAGEQNILQHTSPTIGGSVYAAENRPSRKLNQAKAL